MGPFKHKIDDGLELRKAAFECMDVLLERCRDRINMAEFITHLEKGLQVIVLASSAPCQTHLVPGLKCVVECSVLCQQSRHATLCDLHHSEA